MKSPATLRPIFLVGSVLGFVVACSSSQPGDGSDDPSNPSGGAANAGGTGSSGGTVSTGSSTSSGGESSASGSAASVGGESASSGGAPASGGAPGSGGSDQTGGMTGSGGALTSSADLSINDPVPGWAGEAGGTTGGGTDLSKAVTVSSMTDLKDAAKGTIGAIILVEPGNYSGSLAIGANKTIIGKRPGVVIQGNMSISGTGSYNVIVRNLAIKGNPCATYDECKAGADAVYVGNEAHHVWLDHIDIADGQDGNCDITQGGDYVTVSWSQFHYTYDKEHRFSNLIAGSDDEPKSVGKLRISYMYDWWGDRVNQRSPRGRFGKVHMVNNYHSSQDLDYVAGPGVDAQFLVENCMYEINSGRPAFDTSFGSSAAWKGVGNEGNATGLNSSQGNVFTPPYQYTKLAASAVKGAVTSSACGAGNSCSFE